MSSLCITIKSNPYIHHSLSQTATSPPFPFAPTVHKDVTERLRAQNRELFERVRAVLDKNKAERHMRGGEATKQKYIEQKEKLSPLP